MGAADVERLKQAYKTSLNRDASDEEIEGWTSGKFGGGNINDWERQIGGSHEAAQRAPLAAQAAPGAGYPPPAAPANSWDKFASDNKDVGDRTQLYKNAYKRWTGREADEAGLKSHMTNPGGTEGGLKAIYDSDEAKAYAAANPDAFNGVQKTAPVVDPNAPAAADPAAIQPQKLASFTPKHPMEGFPYDRPYDTGKSAKDAFAVIANDAPPPPIHDKAAVGAWFQQHVAPKMNALGHEVLSVEGDKFTFRNWQGTFTVDFARGAGAEGGALAWQVDPDTAQMANGPYVPQQQSAPPVIQNAVAPVDPSVPYVSQNVDPTVAPVDPAAVVAPVNPATVPVDPVTNQPLSNARNYRRRPYRRHQYQTDAPTVQPRL